MQGINPAALHSPFFEKNIKAGISLEEVKSPKLGSLWKQAVAT
jgi:hypothetical protein